MIKNSLYRLSSLASSLFNTLSFHEPRQASEGKHRRMDTDDPSQPLLSQQRRRASSFRLPSWSIGGPLVKTASVNEVHPHHDEVEPVLPAAPVAATHETRLHKPNWALSDEPPNAWAQFRHAWREEFACVAKSPRSVPGLMNRQRILGHILDPALWSRC